MAIDHSVLAAAFEDQITPISPAIAVFTDDAAETNALRSPGTFKVVFLGFPVEDYGTAADKADLVTRLMTYFGP